ncbi:Beta-lactamase (fragment) [Xenorhabdus bovienii str. puntauvense]|uniref:Beta-lactamase n=2 Tax=Xenorhabdus bovienii TaxID=40576 RepID=A0A077NC78_XENBV
MLVFGRALMAGEKGPLGKAGARVLEPQGKADGEDVGYAIRIRGPAGHRYYHHGGGTGGYRAELAFTPDTQDVLVLLTGNAASHPKRTVSILEARSPSSPKTASCTGVWSD